jgi:hypothetical protein
LAYGTALVRAIPGLTPLDQRWFSVAQIALAIVSGFII